MAKSDYTAAGKALQTQHEQRQNSPLARHKAFLDARLSVLAKWVTQGLRPEALVRFTLADMSNNAKLAACTPESIYLSLLACAVTGLEPGSLRSEAWLVPFGGKAQFIPGYRGLIKQARRSREVHGIHANIVCEADQFSIDLGTDNSVRHQPCLRGERGPVIGAYSIASMTGGHHEIEWMDIADLDHVRKVAESRGKSPAWSEWPEEMQKKTAIRRLAKRLPLGADFFVAGNLEHAAHEAGDQRAIIDLHTDGAGSLSEAQVAAAPPVGDLPADIHQEPDADFDPENVQ